MSEQTTIEGGCFCGAVRYRAIGSPIVASYCHCPTCRKTSGAPVTAWVIFPKSDFSFVKGEPVRLRSSSDVTRTFCGACGTPLTYAADDVTRIDVTCSSLDEPERFPPQVHV